MTLSTSGKAAAVAVALLFGGAVARAEPSAQAPTTPPSQRDPAAAEVLFRSARTLVQAGDFAGACPKFEASFALDPSASTQLNIAKCHEHDGKIATAWSDYARALQLNRDTRGAARQRALAEIANRGMRDLEPRLPRLRIRVDAPPPGLTVVRDGAEVPHAALGEALPVDPGPHELRASAPDRRTETRTVHLEEGQLTEVAFSLAPSVSITSHVPTWVWVTGAAGIALAGASVYFLVDDLSAISALRSHCRESAAGTYCAPGWYDHEGDNARKDRSLALFVGLGGAGVAAIGTAVVGLVVASQGGKPPPPADTAASLWALPSGAGATISGRF